MKKTIVIFIMLYGLVNASAQNGLADKIAKQAVEIDSLKRASKTVVIKIDSLQKIILAKESSNKQLLLSHQVSEKKNAETIKDLKKELAKLEKYKSKKKDKKWRLKMFLIVSTSEAKSDTIILLKTTITQKDNEIKTISEKSKKDAVIEKENGKNEALNQLVNTYKKKGFDELIVSSNISSVQRDKQLIGNNTDIKQIINDLEIYFIAENLLSNKFNAAQVKNYISQVGLIKQQSKLVDVLKDNLSNFKTFNDGLNTSIQNIIAIDKKEIVKGMSEQVVKSKLNKVLSELSKFIFDYNFNFVDYPYFSDIVLEIIKRKQPNPDADIIDLLSKIE